MKVNGEMKALRQCISLKQFLEQEGYNCSRVAVECNGQIIPKSDYQDTELSDADNLEIVHFVGGG